MIALSAMLWLTAVVSGQPKVFAAIEALYASAATNDEVKFSSIIGKDLGFFAAPDFIVPMKFTDFKEFVKVCNSPEFKGSAVDQKMATLTTVTVEMRCKVPEKPQAINSGFDFWLVDGKVIAIRPEGMR